eukprot:COSAG02_NODE_7708_length_2882_cov_1.418613_2_plen_84_part_00
MGKQSKEVAGSGSIYEQKPVLAPTMRKLLELCTADGEEKPPEEKLSELFDAMRAASSDDCAAIGGSTSGSGTPLLTSRSRPSC